MGGTQDSIVVSLRPFRLLTLELSLKIVATVLENKHEKFIELNPPLWILLVISLIEVNR